MVAYRKLVTPDESSELRGFLFSREKKKIHRRKRSIASNEIRAFDEEG